MTDIVGPIIAIALVFGIYYGAKFFDTFGERKILREESQKIDAESKLREQEVRLFELQLEREKLYDSRNILPMKDVETDYKFLDDQREG